MKKRKPLFGWALLLLVLAGTAVLLSVAPRGAVGAKSPENVGADIIVIDDMSAFGRLELPGVTFRHDRHTEALAKQGKDCVSCHAENTNPAKTANWVYKFKRSEDKSYAELKEIYHTGCLSCHTEESAAGRPSGPKAAECRSCHIATPPPSARLEMGMDKYLHQNHIEAENIRPVGGDGETNCSACHHIFDPKNTRTQRSWKKHEEDSCRSCHKSAESPNPDDKSRSIPALANASHDACISCHFDQAKRFGPEKSGPYICAGCHGASSQAELARKTESDLAKKRETDVKRLDRGQPDGVMLLPIPANIKTADIKGSMAPVPFDHKVHEAAMDTCRTCHHEGRIAACSSCHSLEGGEKGNFVNLATAMHKPDSVHSCIGCHSTRTQEATCAGCHAAMPKTQSQQSCAACHITPVGTTQAQATDGSLLKMDKELLNRMAVSTIRDKNAKKSVINMQDVPEKVLIGVIADEYKAVELPHRKIVESLDKAMFENALAQSFHKDVTTMCQGCHHNSPASLTPPKCASCHSAGDAPGSDGRPPLKVAYHNQCMGCHSAIKLEKPANTDCVGCHALAEKSTR